MCVAGSVVQEVRSAACTSTVGRLCLLRCRGVAQNKALEDLFIAPFAVPKPPSRFYYIFQEPVWTAPEDLKDPAKISALYQQVRSLSRTYLHLFCFPKIACHEKRP